MLTPGDPSDSVTSGGMGVSLNPGNPYLRIGSRQDGLNADSWGEGFWPKS